MEAYSYILESVIDKKILRIKKEAQKDTRKHQKLWLHKLNDFKIEFKNCDSSKELKKLSYKLDNLVKNDILFVAIDGVNQMFEQLEENDLEAKTNNKLVYIDKVITDNIDTLENLMSINYKCNTSNYYIKIINKLENLIYKVSQPKYTINIKKVINQTIFLTLAILSCVYFVFLNSNNSIIKLNFLPLPVLFFTTILYLYINRLYSLLKVLLNRI